jgi:hypothetical protein
MPRGVWALLAIPLWTFAQPSPPAFQSREIATQLGVVYAVTTADVNNDRRPDIVALTGTQLLWFENPTWTRHVVAEKVTAKDHVAIAPHDIDRDGRVDFALAADWQSTNTTSGGSLHWVSHSGAVHAIFQEPTIHRIGWIDVDSDGRAELVVVPLHGRGTKAPGWTQGPGARILVFRVPAQPAAQPWPMEVASDTLHIAHNFIGVGPEIWVASAEGVHALSRDRAGKWSQRKLADGQPGEIKLGRAGARRLLATVEPWHGHSVAVYEEAAPLWRKSVIDTGLQQAHALGWADFDGDGRDELVAGWRNPPWGLALYRFHHNQWTKSPIDDGVAVEDLAIADLDSDGRPEIIAGGRATSNLRIYSLPRNP